VARDGIQLAWENYVRGAAGTRFLLSPGGRIDLLIQAPQTPGEYMLVFWPPVTYDAGGGSSQSQDLRSRLVLTLRVGGLLDGENTAWYDPSLETRPANYPVFPDFMSELASEMSNEARQVEVIKMLDKDVQSETIARFHTSLSASSLRR
jgi:hypothetical protein